MKNRWICLVLSFMLCLFALPAAAAGTVYKLAEELIIPNVDLPDNDELFAAYADRMFYPDRQISFFGTAAGNRLADDKQKAIYDQLKSVIESVAAGTQASTSAVIDLSAIGYDTTISAKELGYVSITADNAEVAALAAFELIAEQTGLERVLDALLSDCPYDLYWYDKTSEGGFRYIKSCSYTEDGSISIDPLNCRFGVARAYQPEGYDASAPEVDIAKTGATAAAVTEANRVVSENQNKSDYEKLVAYRNYICGAVAYNDSAASSSYAGGYGDPWQLIYVFDGDADTKVVCEGYAKAFQYLCDLTAFSNDISCYSVSGVMKGDTGAGNHMWNIVTMDDGKNYLVDITNSDAGTIGQDGGLFLDAPASGSIDDGYTFAIPNQVNISYTYDTDTEEMWGTDTDSILNLAASSYAEAVHAHNWSYTAEGNVITATCAGEGKCSIADQTATVTITGGTYTYDGNAKQAAVRQNPENTFTDLAITYSGNTTNGLPVNADRYTASVKLDTVTATAVLTIEKADGPAAPVVTGNYALNEADNTYTYTVNAIDGAEYRMDEGEWQDSAVFTGIAPNSAHTFFARIKETENVKAGAEGTTGEVVFNKLPGSGTVSIAGWTYGQEANEPVPVSSTNGTDNVTYLYKSTDEKGYSAETAPSDAGCYKLTATFAANDTYGECTATTEFVIAKATPEFTVPNGLTATYGDTLSSVTLPDGWAWNDAENTPVGDAGSRTFGATYTHPTKPENYETAQATLTIIVGEKTVTATVTVAEGTYVYDGQPHEPAVTVMDGETVIDVGEYTPEYRDNVNVGTAKVLITDKDGGNYVVSGESTFSIVQSASDVTAQADKAEYTYGETITVTAEASATGSAPAATGFGLLRVLTAPASDQMALYLGDTQISEAVSVGNDGVYTMTYNTTDKALTVGSHTLTVRYAGNNDMASASASVNVTIKPRTLTVDSAAAENRTYEPDNKQVKITSVTLGNAIAGDDVLANAETGEVGSANAGTYTAVMLGVSLSGDDAAFYEIATPAMAAATVIISPKELTAEVRTAQSNYIYTGAVIEPTVVVMDGGEVIPSDEYLVSYDNQINAGEAMITVSDKEGGNYIVSGKGSFTIDKAKLTITADSLRAFVGQEMPELTYRVTGLIGSDQLTEVPEISCDPDMSKAGTYAITVSGAQAGGNYEIVYQNGVLYVVTAGTEGVVTKISQTGLTQVPEGLLDTEFNTVDKIVAEMQRTLVNEVQGYTVENTAHYDVKLQFSLDGGRTWVNATEDNFPAEGIRIRIAYPAGTGRYTHDFVVSHMFTATSDRLGTVAGETEQPAVTKLDNGLEVTLTGLSPVSVAWKPIVTASEINSLPQTGDSASLLLWLALGAAGLIGLMALKVLNRRRMD